MFVKVVKDNHLDLDKTFFNENLVRIDYDILNAKSP